MKENEKRKKRKSTSVFPFVVLYVNENEKRENGSQLPFFLLSFCVLTKTKNEKRKSTSVFPFFVFNEKKDINEYRDKERGKKEGGVLRSYNDATTNKALPRGKFLQFKIDL